MVRAMSDHADTLIQKAVAGDTEALTVLLRMHGPAVESALVIERTWQGVLEPADVMQVTYLEAFIRIKSFDPAGDATFATWLRRVAENNLKDAIRGLTRQKRPPPQNRVVPAAYEDSVAELYDLIGVTTATPSRQIGRREICGLLEKSIEALPEDYARVIRLYDLDGKPIGDVAQAMGRSPGAVHMMRARAHDQLRALLGRESMILGSHGA